ncbi:MAG: 16S rRNA (uracil(1498)-N(3))-methyltransferase [Cyanobacteriota bacterium]|nr:16S rRNA (uracil(1498)-N(3))-methyltransferase [Cyanobacteriota bacterium]
MVREQRRLLITPERLALAAAGAMEGPVRVPLSSSEAHYLQRVLRLRQGDGFAVLDGAGHLWQADLADQSARLATPLARPLQTQPQPLPALQLAVALPRRDSDVLLRMACELGIDRLQPLLAERSVAERWNPERAAVIVREAVEQCERLWSPQLQAPQPAATWFPQVQGLRLLAATRDRTSRPLAALLADHHCSDAPVVTVAIGPEGGWSPAEWEQAQACGWQSISLGSTILRTSTAAVAAAAALCSWRAGPSESG